MNTDHEYKFDPSTDPYFQYQLQRLAFNHRFQFWVGGTMFIGLFIILGFIFRLILVMNKGLV